MNSIPEPQFPELALNGGEAVCQWPMAPWPITDDSIREVFNSVLQDGAWGRYHSHYSSDLQDEICREHNVQQALLCCSGTIGVELALRALGAAEGDEVILAGYDFPGNFRAIEAVGAAPVLVDIVPNTWSLDVNQVAAACTAKTKFVIASHLHGGLVEMFELQNVAKELGLLIVEDVCQSPGARIAGQPVGSFGDVAVLSFGGSKPLTAGRGGAVLSDNEAYIQRARIFGQRGNDAFALSELQAALLVPQYQQLQHRVQKRMVNATLLKEELADVAALRVVDWGEHVPSFFKFAILLEPAVFAGELRTRFVAAAQAEGVVLAEAFRGFTKRSARRCRRASSLAHADAAAKATVVLHHPVLLGSAEQIRNVAYAIKKVAYHVLGAP